MPSVVAATTALLPALTAANVVDAGGLGFALLLDALQYVVSGRALPEPSTVAVPEVAMGEAAAEPRPMDGPRYELMFLLDGADDAALSSLRSTWATLGESIAVVGGDGGWNCHVHTDDVDACVEAATIAGQLSRIEVTDLTEQVHQLHGHDHDTHRRSERDQEMEQSSGSGRGVPERSERDQEMVVTGVVAVAVGAGLGRLLRSVGAREIVTGGQTANPSTAELLAAVERVPAEGIVVLPNNGNVIAVAEQLDRLTERVIRVVPTRSVVEALAALVVYDEDAALEVNVTTMIEAAARVRAGDVTRAVRAVSTARGAVVVGDWLALADGAITAIAGSPSDAAIALVDHLVTDDSELVTVLVGADASSRETDRVRDHLGREHAHVEVEIHEGDQPLYPYLIGVE